MKYRRLGSLSFCLECQTNTEPTVPLGGSHPATGWELTFRDFLMLVQALDSREQVAPLLDQWFDYLVGDGPR